MKRCDSYNGICECHENVIGDKCDRCQDDHYGFSSCQGCQPCNCGLASESSQCADEDGKCRCKPGVEGRTCDQCMAGFWNYSPDGCICTYSPVYCTPPMRTPYIPYRLSSFFSLSLSLSLFILRTTACGCTTGYSRGASCNPITGQCECLPGVLGEKCDHCPHRTVLDERRGCQNCDKCTHDLLDVTDELDQLINPVSNSFKVSRPLGALN
jgi:laminin alpha 3/5